MIKTESKIVDEIGLINRAKRGDADAFAILYENYAESIYRFFCAHLEFDEDAEDLTIDVFVRTWQSLPTYNDRGLPFQAFLFKVARNILVDHFRQKKDSYQLTEDFIDMNRKSPEEQAVVNSERIKIQKILGRMHKDYGLVLILRFFSGLNSQEIAHVMARSEAAIRVMQFRALQALKKLLTEEEFDEG